MDRAGLFVEKLDEKRKDLEMLVAYLETMVMKNMVKSRDGCYVNCHKFLTRRVQSINIAV